MSQVLSYGAYTVTDLALSGGFWTAKVTQAGETYSVNRRFGSWRCDVELNGKAVAFEVLPHVAARLQSMVNTIIRAERRASGAEVRAAA